jgi:AraC family transcriptional regulator
MFEEGTMTEARRNGLESPRFDEREAMLIAGLGEAYTFDKMEQAFTGIPAQWQRFGPQIGRILGLEGGESYGVTFDIKSGESFRYLAGVEVSSLSELPSDLGHVSLRPHTYAIFAHRGHVSTIRDTIDAIFHRWLPESGHQFAGGADYYFERYDEAFDPATGEGGFEIWVPIED